MADRLQVFDAQVGFQLAFMGSLTFPILAMLPAATAIVPMLLTILALTALAVIVMDLLAQFDGQHAKQPALDLVPAPVLIALHEPSLRSMIERRAAAPSHAPPSYSHLVRLTVLPRSFLPALSDWLTSRQFNSGVSQRA